MTAVPLYRVHEIPDVDPGFSSEKYTRPVTPEEKATMKLYRQAVEALYPRWPPSELEQVYCNQPRALTKEEIAQINANQKAIGLALRASRSSFVQLIDKNSNWELYDIQCLPRWLILGAIKLGDEGKLDAALDHLLAAMRVCAQVRSCVLGAFWWADRLETITYRQLTLWAARPHQTAARILAASRQWNEAISRSSLTDPLKLEYLHLRRVLQGDLAAAIWYRDGSGASLPPLPVLLWLQLPWERQRALRLLNLQTALELDLARLPRRAGDAPYPNYKFWQEMQPVLRRPAIAELLYVMRGEMVPPLVEYTWEGTSSLRRRYFPTLAETVLAIETARNATRVILALEAWKREHGTLPKRLEQLVGPYLDRLPLDPCSGEPFHYLPDGLSLPLHLRGSRFGWVVWPSSGAIPAKTPLVWSIGTDVRKTIGRPTKDLVDRYEIEEHQFGGWHQAMSECDVWQSGWPFVIP